ncbi:MAG: beta-ketoacyl synthase, partial [Pseudomonadota bacterium]
MKRLPVIVGLGGINPAGRVSFHHAYRRLVIDALGSTEQDRTFESLATLMGIEPSGDADVRQQILDQTLIRRIEHFDPERIYVNRTARL